MGGGGGDGVGPAGAAELDAGIAAAVWPTGSKADGAEMGSGGP